MRTRIILQLAILSILALVTCTNGLFFHYPRNALIDFFQSLYRKKEAKKLPQNIHHYHLHYYPVYTHVFEKAIKAPTKLNLDKLHSNHLETLGWNDNEFKRVPEPEIYATSPFHDSWSESSDTRSSIWDEDISHYPRQALELEEVPAADIIVNVPIRQKIVIQRPAVPNSKTPTNPFVSFIQGFKRIKSTLFDNNEANDKTDSGIEKPEDDQIKDYVLYLKQDFGRKL